LGHVYRKLGKLPEALQFHQQALSLQPLNGSTYAAIGLVHMMMNNLLEAIEAFHEALGLKPDDSFSTTMLSYAMEGLTLSPADGLGEPFEGWFQFTASRIHAKSVFDKGEPADLPPNLRNPTLFGSPSEPLMTPQRPAEEISDLSIECDMQDSPMP
jgi:tetratricopeptide (TPR) repeat protein